MRPRGQHTLGCPRGHGRGARGIAAAARLVLDVLLQPRAQVAHEQLQRLVLVHLAHHRVAVQRHLRELPDVLHAAQADEVEQLDREPVNVEWELLPLLRAEVRRLRLQVVMHDAHVGTPARCQRSDSRAAGTNIAVSQLMDCTAHGLCACLPATKCTSRAATALAVTASQHAGTCFLRPARGDADRSLHPGERAQSRTAPRSTPACEQATGAPASPPPQAPRASC